MTGNSDATPLGLLTIRRFHLIRSRQKQPLRKPCATPKMRKSGKVNSRKPRAGTREAVNQS
jgi:hypothetical protein